MDLPKINIFDLRLSQLGGWVGGGGGWGKHLFSKIEIGIKEFGVNQTIRLQV